MSVEDSQFRCHPASQGESGGSSVGLLPSMTPGRPISRSRGVTPSSVAPECLGDSKSRAGTRVRLYMSVACLHGAPAVAGSVVAMTKPVSRDAKQKGPKESMYRALMNCASGKYCNRPIKPMSLDMSLENWSIAKVRSLQVLRCSFAASRVCSLRCVRPALYFMRSTWKGWE